MNCLVAEACANLVQPRTLEPPGPVAVVHRDPTATGTLVLDIGQDEQDERLEKYEFRHCDYVWTSY